jgi:hypothetical protein
MCASYSLAILMLLVGLLSLLSCYKRRQPTKCLEWITSYYFFRSQHYNRVHRSTSMGYAHLVEPSQLFKGRRKREHPHDESISNRGLRGLLLNFRLLFGSHSRIPANEALPELIIEDLPPHLEQIVRAGLAPSHLLLLHHALAHDLIHRGLCEGR